MSLCLCGQVGALLGVDLSGVESVDVNVQMCSLVCSKAMCPCLCPKYRVSLCVPPPGHAACPGEAPRSPIQ